MTHWGVTYVTMWDEENLLKNIQFVMILEVMGLGPAKYCIVNSVMPNFERRLMLLLYSLTQKKMCTCPLEVYLGLPFDHSPWRDIREAICSRRPHLKSPLLCIVYYTQKITIFLKTRVYEPPYWVQEFQERKEILFFVSFFDMIISKNPFFVPIQQP